MDLLSNPRVVELLRQADTALRMLSTADRSTREDFEEALRSIYSDVGKLVHGLHRTRKAVPASIDRSADETEVVGRYDEPMLYTEEIGLLDDASEEVWYTEEVDITGEITPPLGTPVTARAHELGTLAETPSVAGQSPESPEWLPRLQDLLDLLPHPLELGGQQELAVEATRIQWATSGMGVHWRRYPQAVQVALLGLLTARARHLQEVLNVEVGPKLALDRLRRHQLHAKLPSVVGLYPDQKPEFRTWLDDAAHWFNSLQKGVLQVEEATL